MSLFSTRTKIDGLACGPVMRGVTNGEYHIIFERKCATLEQIEGINWERPTLEGDSILPVGYSFEVKQITYSSSENSYHVTIRVAKQFLGDVTAYQEQIAELLEGKQALADQNTAQRAQITELEEQLAEADEALITMYEQQAASAEPDTGEATGENAGEDAGENAGEGAGEEETE